jgi:preprotein translocase subunit SecB
MSEETLNGAVAPAEAATGASFTVEKIYAKDVSFEVPGAPAVFNEQAQPQLQMNLNQSVQRINDDTYEVVLGITLTCTADEKPLYLVEVKQAGVFGMTGFEPAQLDGMLGTQCPNVLYPYARALISSLVQAGGFPPFFLQPINFEALYAEGLRQRAAQQGEGLVDGLDGVETAGNA